MSPSAIPETGAVSGTPRSHEREREPQVAAMEDEPFDSRILQ